MKRLLSTMMLLPMISLPACAETGPLNLVKPLNTPHAVSYPAPAVGMHPLVNEETNPISPNATVIMGEIQDVKPESIGLLDETQQGLPFESWKGTPYKTIHKVLTGMPNRFPSQTLYTLSRKLLMSSLEVPSESQTEPSENLLVVRAAKLAELGNMKEAFNLLENLRSAQNNPKAQKIKCSYFLGTSDIDQAYSIAKEQLSHSSDPFWEKTLIVCQILKKETDQALLSLSLFDEKYGQKEPVFIDVVRSQLDPSYSIDLKGLSQTQFDLPLFTLLNHKGFTSKTLNALSSHQQGMLLSHFNPLNVEPADRLKLVEKAVNLGTLSEEELEKNYEYYLQANPLQEKLPEMHPESASKIIGGIVPDTAREDSAPKRTFYYGQSKYGKTPQEKLEGIIMLLENAFHNRISNGILKTVEPFLSALEPQPLSSSIAALFTKSFASLGREDLIVKWHAYLNTENTHPALPLLILYAHTIPHDIRQNLLKAWYHKLLDQSPNKAPHIAGKVYSILDALGISISADLWEELPASPPSQAVLLPYDQQALLKNAAQHKRVAETIARLLIAANPDAQTFNAENLPFLLKSLKDAGLQKEAYALATDYLIELEEKELSSIHDAK